MENLVWAIVVLNGDTKGRCQFKGGDVDEKLQKERSDCDPSFEYTQFGLQ